MYAKFGLNDQFLVSNRLPPRVDFQSFKHVREQRTKRLEIEPSFRHETLVELLTMAYLTRSIVIGRGSTLREIRSCESKLIMAEHTSH